MEIPVFLLACERGNDVNSSASSYFWRFGHRSLPQRSRISIELGDFKFIPYLYLFQLLLPLNHRPLNAILFNPVAFF
jgi:hypothetical protein